MNKFPQCKKEGCGQRVQAVGLCATHYELMLFGDQPEILGELETMCSNSLCDKPIEQPRDELGNVINRRLYCETCRALAVGRGTQRIPMDDFFTEECDDCGKVYGRVQLNNPRHICQRCTTLRKKKRASRQKETKK